MHRPAPQSFSTADSRSAAALNRYEAGVIGCVRQRTDREPVTWRGPDSGCCSSKKRPGGRGDLQRGDPDGVYDLGVLVRGQPAAAADHRRPRPIAWHGLQLQALDGTFTPLRHGRALTRWHDPAKTRESLLQFSRRDADNYPVFGFRMLHLGRAIRDLLLMRPSRVDAVRPLDLRQPSRARLALRGNPAPALSRSRAPA